jgi:carboxyl-terminal processing protease
LRLYKRGIQKPCLIKIAKNLLPVLVFLLLIRQSPWCRADEKTSLKPLFPIQLDHEFPESKKSFEKIKDLIIKHYYNTGITEKALYWAAIQGMLRHISPPEKPDLSKIWTPEEYETYRQSLEGIQVSVGIKSSFNANEGSLTVTRVLPGSPADSILKPLDRILRIDGLSLKGKSLEELNKLLTGKEGTAVTLTVNRDIKIFDVTLKHRKFETASLIVNRLTDTIALLEINKFTANISKKLKDELKKLKDDKFRGLIIDLRNNQGGIFQESLRTAELFLPKKRILSRTVQQKTGLQNYVSDNPEPFEYNMAILVNQNTASSAEVLSSALQDHKKALLIGTRTFGKGVFERTFTLENNYRVKFITGAMYSPAGRTWQSNGIVPDFLVEQDEKTLAHLFSLEAKERFRKDVAMITAYKLLSR